MGPRRLAGPPVAHPIGSSTPRPDLAAPTPVGRPWPQPWPGCPDAEREVVFLRYWLDLGVDQTAASLGISTGSVKTHASRALERLRADLADLRDPAHPDQEDRP